MDCDIHAWYGLGDCPFCKQEKKVKELERGCVTERAATQPVTSAYVTQPGYEPLAAVLQAALDQSQAGKGKERHATTGKPFLDQPICEIGRMMGVGYNIGQAMKKGQEAMRLPRERAQAELLGGIVYLAAAYILLGEVEG